MRVDTDSNVAAAQAAAREAAARAEREAAAQAAREAAARAAEQQARTQQSPKPPENSVETVSFAERRGIEPDASREHFNSRRFTPPSNDRHLFSDFDFDAPPAPQRAQTLASAQPPLVSPEQTGDSSRSLLRNLADKNSILGKTFEFVDNARLAVTNAPPDSLLGRTASGARELWRAVNAPSENNPPTANPQIAHLTHLVPARDISAQNIGATSPTTTTAITNKPSPGEALDEINRLPVSDINDPAAIRSHNQQRVEIADEALRNAVPPERSDFASLNGRTADYEYREAKTAYDNQIRELESVSSAAKTRPTELPLSAALTPSQAVERINELPTPPLSDAAATQEYQEQRAAIADAAVESAVPPTRDDFKALPPQVAAAEYRDAVSSYNSQLSELRNISSAAKAELQNPPAPSPLDAAAERVWDAYSSDPQAGAQALAQEAENLNAKYGPEAGGQLVSRLQQDTQNRETGGENLYNLLSFAGGEEFGAPARAGLPQAQRDVIGAAVGQAYDLMSADNKKDFIKHLTYAIERNGTRGSTGGDNTRLADIISLGDNQALKEDLFDALSQRMVEIKPGPLNQNNGGANIKALANSAAMLALGSDPQTQVEMFNQLIQSFPEMNETQFNSLMDDPAFKDRMSTLFINNSAEITQSLTDVNGRFPDTASIDGLKKFFELTMFSKNPGELRDEVMAEGVALVSSFADPNAPATDGRNKEADAYTAGALTAVIQSAANDQEKSILAGQESRQQTTQMFIGLAFSFAPGASSVLGEGANKGLEFAYGEAVEYAQSNAESALGGMINDMVDGDALKNTEEGFDTLRELATSIPSEVLVNNDDSADSFDLGYTKASDLLAIG